MTDLAIILLIVGALLVVQIVVMIYFYIKRADQKARGLILEDELTQTIKHRAGYHTYWIAWVMWLGIFVLDSFGILSGTGEIKPNWVIWSGVMIMWAIYNLNIFLLKREKNE